jgi:hypothetical protein
MLAFRVMEVLRRGRGASLLAFCGAFVALQCGQEEFDLLSTGQAAGGNQATGGGGTSSQPPHGTGGSSEPPSPECLPGHWCPECDNDDRDCSDFQDRPYCVGTRCVACKSLFDGKQVGCDFDWKCDRYVCREPCRGPDDDCPRGYLCDVDYQRFTCVECKERSDCEGSSGGRDECFEGKCVECLNDFHCPNGTFCLYFACEKAP